MWFLFVIGFDFGILVVVIVTAAARVVVVISNNFCVFISCGGSRCICSCSGVNRSCGGSSIAHLFLTYHYHYHHHHHSQHHNHHLHSQLHHRTLNYGTFDDVGISDIGLVVMVVVVMVGYLGCWWNSDVFSGDDNCGNGGSCD